MNDECQYCSGSGPCCQAIDPATNFVCLRDDGHPVPHVACGSAHSIAIWANDDYEADNDEVL